MRDRLHSNIAVERDAPQAGFARSLRAPHLERWAAARTSLGCFELSVYIDSIDMRPRVFRDPVHVNVEFSRSTDGDKLGLALVETPQVQRLRRIRQLGLAALVYHGAKHSRFNHTLGVAHLATRKGGRSALRKLMP